MVIRNVSRTKYPTSQTSRSVHIPVQSTVDENDTRAISSVLSRSKILHETLTVTECCLKTYHYIIFFVRPLHFKPGMESYCSPSTDQLSWWLMVLLSVRRDRAVDYEGFSLWSDVS